MQVQADHGPLYILQENKVIRAYDEKGHQQGLGADDKNGIWIALQLLKTEPILKCAFFVEEEIGCRGSEACDMKFFKDSKYVLQCDRKGKDDIILETYSTALADYDFIPDEILDKYGYSPNYGLMTDVETLKERGLGVACCNMSCGYYNPHTAIEETHVDDLINCLNFVKEIIAIVSLTKHKYDPTVNTRRLYSTYGGYGADYGPYYWGQSYRQSCDNFTPTKSSGSYYDWDWDDYDLYY